MNGTIPRGHSRLILDHSTAGKQHGHQVPRGRLHYSRRLNSEHLQPNFVHLLSLTSDLIRVMSITWSPTLLFITCASDIKDILKATKPPPTPLRTPKSPPPIHVPLGVSPEPFKWLVHLPGHFQLINLHRRVTVLGDVVPDPERGCWPRIWPTV